MEHADDPEQQQAYQAVLDYLVATGAYIDADEADNEAGERVKFCEEIDFYADNEQLKNATIYEKKRQVLIHANDLYDIIAENDGDLPIPVHSDTSADSAVTNDADVTDDETVTRPETGGAVVPEPDEEALAEPVAEIEDTTRRRQNPFLRIVLNLGTSAIITGVLLVSMTMLFNSEQQLQIIKYGFILFALLTLLFVALLEAHNETSLRMRSRVGHSLFITAASLSGLLLMQPLWDESTFTPLDGLRGLLLNPIIHDIHIIGPYRVGIFFAVIALLVFIATHTSTRPSDKQIHD